MQVEAAISCGEYSEGWYARLTFKCPLCGKRHVVKQQGKGSQPKVFSVDCKNGLGAAEVVPYQHLV